MRGLDRRGHLLRNEGDCRRGRSRRRHRPPSARSGCLRHRRAPSPAGWHRRRRCACSCWPRNEKWSNQTVFHPVGAKGAGSDSLAVDGVLARRGKTLVVADLQVPAVRILDPETFERALVVGHRRHAALAAVRPPRSWRSICRSPRQRLRIAARGGGCAGRPALGTTRPARAAQDAVTPIADIHDGALAVVLPQLPAHQGGIKGGLFA